MAGADDHGAVIGDWGAFNPSPRTFFSTMLGESYMEVYGENGSDGLFAVSGKNKTGMEFEDMNDKRDSVSSDRLTKVNVIPNQQQSSRGGLTERLAARAGFNAPRLNTSKIRSAGLASSPDARSPYLTIPPGLSPTTLLDSPVFLSNCLAQPSPTTGKFSFPTSNNKDTLFEDFDASSFAFKPHVEPGSLYFRGGENKLPMVTNHQQSFANIELSIQSEKPLQPPNVQDAESHALSRSTFHPPADILSSSIDQANVSGNNRLLSQVSNITAPNVEHSPPLNDQQDGDGERGNGESNAMAGAGASSEDGYNWRKYGQKVVKGSEYPRSYYKCTHQNCQVKKKVERSHEGHVTEIIYKGAHNHPKPPPNRRSGLGSSNPQSDMQSDVPEHAGANSDPAWTSSQRIGLPGGLDLRHDNLEATSSTSVVPKELCEPSNSIQAKNGSHLEAADAVDVSSTVYNDENEEDRATHGSVTLGYDGEGDESESKRRKIDACAMEMTGASRSIREPRVVVQTTSEVDILDDGYRWRKYGQKVVKGNPNPRSYYKCTNAGCTVRKHVERASHDLKSVITTYEGKHNHDVPAARNSSHVSTGTSTTAPPASGGQTHIHRPEPSQIRDRIARLDGPSSLGGSTFNLHGRQHQQQQLGPTPGFSFGMSQSGLANLAMAGLGPGQGKLPAYPIHQYLGQQRAANEAGIMVPKGELKDEHASDSGLNLPNGSSIYQQFMNRLPISPEW